MGTEPLNESQAVELEHSLGGTRNGVEMKLVDLRSSENPVLVKLDQNLKVSLCEPMCVGGYRPQKIDKKHVNKVEPDPGGSSGHPARRVSSKDDNGDLAG
jgi:hypothetical protein